MNMCVMLSINPPHVGRIFEGFKRVIMRKAGQTEKEAAIESQNGVGPKGDAVLPTSLSFP